MRKDKIDHHLEKNRAYFNKLYHLPKNRDIVIREFRMGLNHKTEAFLAYFDGMVDSGAIIEGILKPLLNMDRPQNGKINPERIKEQVLVSNEVEIGENWKDTVAGVNYGMVAILIDGCNQSVLVDVKGWEHRPVSQPEVEQVIHGPLEAFNETLRTNIVLIRKAIRNENLVTEILEVGRRSRTSVAVMYMSDLVSPELLAQVKKRVASISADYVGGAGVLEQFIEDHPWMLFPQFLSTERPDRSAAFLMEGKVVIILDGNPTALIAPATLLSLLHSPEDYYLRLPYGNFIRILRLIAMIIAVVTPAFYLSIATHHQEMIPTDFLISLAQAREQVPFPTIVEIILMEISFELIREAGVRVPGIIGNTIGIVGALILGQATVQANMVSPILIIVVAITGLASYSIPNYELGFALREIRFIYTLAAAFFGFLGISATLFFTLMVLSSKESFGVPYLTPLAPNFKSSPDRLTRGPVWSMERRPEYLHPQGTRRQSKISRGWVISRPARRFGHQTPEKKGD
ncbi:MAG: spore germination protein [Peptococcaceae bacterium]|nr:spore germination protein [Peptococcaceae bacterium]